MLSPIIIVIYHVDRETILLAKDLFHIKWLRNKTDFISTTDLSIYFPLHLTLKPNIPHTDPTREDAITPRVCFSTSLAGSVGSLGLSHSNAFYLGIYKPINPIEIFYPGSKVHDAEKWGEVWSLRPVFAELQRIIIPGELLY